MDGGTGVFLESGQQFAVGQVHKAHLGDVDGDDDLDAILSRYDRSQGSAEIWLNDGSGQFVRSQPLLAGYVAALADLDADGDLDAVVTRSAEAGSWLNDGTGQFVPSNRPSAPRVDALGDVNGDGYLDMMAEGVW